MRTIALLFILTTGSLAKASIIGLPFEDDAPNPRQKQVQLVRPDRPSPALPGPPRMRSEALAKPPPAKPSVAPAAPARGALGGVGLATVDTRTDSPAPRVQDISSFRCPNATDDPEMAEKMVEQILGIRNAISHTFEKNLDVTANRTTVKSQVTLSKKTGANNRPVLLVSYVGEIRFSIQGSVCINGNEIQASGNVFGTRQTIQLRPIRQIPNSIRIVTPLTPEGDVYTAR